MKDLYIIGAGGFGREVAWLAERINQKEALWNIKGFIDDNDVMHGHGIGGYDVVGNTEYLLGLSQKAWVICAIGSSKIRKKVVEKIKRNPMLSFATLIDPSVLYSSRVEIGEGSIVCAGTIITVDVKIGKHVIINLDCTVGHDDIIGDFVTVNPSVNISGNVLVDELTELGTGTHIIQGKRVGKESIIGAGAVVVRDIPDKCTAVGNPARAIKFFD